MGFPGSGDRKIKILQLNRLGKERREEEKMGGESRGEERRIGEEIPLSGFDGHGSSRASWTRSSEWLSMESVEDKLR